ncbi:hypothetical protein [Cryobacterium sp. M23]|uniref:hypothetical protein n=1 Tax=Cryobacterium sp. M23 TaxID=2048292 RepID=UPI000CE3677A|nr:hypothetical protein [Cryobacterium sp. M23]
MNDTRDSQYRKLVRWYPPAWRERNEEAIVAVLMDEDDAEGRVGPTLSSRLALIAAGLYERFIAPERLSRVGLGALVLSVVFSVWYLGVITWAPSITYSGTFGPFSNPSVIVGGMLVVALILALFSRGRTARFIALLSVPAIILIGILSSVHSWLGPSVPAVVIFAGLSLAASSPLRSASDAGRVAGAFVLVLVGLFLTDLLRAHHFDFGLSPILVVQGVGVVASFIGALALLWPSARNLRRASKPAASRG